MKKTLTRIVLVVLAVAALGACDPRQPGMSGPTAPGLHSYDCMKYWQDGHTGCAP